MPDPSATVQEQISKARDVVNSLLRQTKATILIAGPGSRMANRSQLRGTSSTDCMVRLQDGKIADVWYGGDFAGLLG